MIKRVLLSLLMTSCIEQNPPAPIDYNGHRDMVMIGDSNCSEGREAIPWKIAGISGDCVPGRPLMDIHQLHKGMRLTFIALGTNDAAYGYSPKHYQDRLWHLMTQRSGDVYCILPTVDESFHGYDVEPYRDAMRRVCTNIIDPEVIGSDIFWSDGIHYHDDGNTILGNYMKEVIDG